MPECKDKFGRLVLVGARIRLLELSTQLLESLPPDELEDVRLMQPRDRASQRPFAGPRTHEMELIDA